MRRRRNGVLALGAALAVAAVVPAAAGATTLNYTTPGTYTFKVPDTVAKLTVSATGAGGGLDSGVECTPGEGGNEQASVPVSPGGSVTIVVAGRGGSGSGTTGGAAGIGGGGAGGSSTDEAGGAGGGASSLAQKGTTLVVAAGGGGCGGFGGNGGNDGASGSNGTLAFGGGPGTQTAGGTGGASSNSADAAGGDGSLGQGGAGAGDTNQNGGGGGGGGGYYGGGGGGGVRSGDEHAGGGGGGSDYAISTAKSVTTESGINAGDGSVTITYTSEPPPTAITDAASNVEVNTATLNGDVTPNSLPFTWYIEYGKTTAYGQKTPTVSAGASSGDVPVAVDVSGLKAGTTYHFQILAHTASGTAEGGDLTFKTTAQPTILVTPGKVNPGYKVRVHGNASVCPAGDQLALLSHAFSGAHKYAGVPAVYTTVKPNGSYAVTTKIPGGRHGRYKITGRCGGGGLGVVAHLSVTRAASTAPTFTG